LIGFLIHFDLKKEVLMSKVCPKCGMLNADDRVVCTNCGTVLPANVASAPQGQPVPAPTQTYNAANQPIPVPVPVPAPVPVYAPALNMPKKRYGVLRTVSGILNVLAWISFVFGVLGGLLGGIFGIGAMSGRNAGTSVFGVLAGILGGLILGLIWFVLFKYSAEIIHLAIDVEENTRRTADLLDKMQK
jgi:ribosomal protein S27AE